MTITQQEHDRKDFLRVGMTQLWNERDRSATKRYFTEDIVIHFPTEYGAI